MRGGPAGIRCAEGIAVRYASCWLGTVGLLTAIALLSPAARGESPAAAPGPQTAAAVAPTPPVSASTGTPSGAPPATPAAEISAREAMLVAKKCGGCHSIGEGDRTGPDLLGVTRRRDKKWIAAFIRTPGAVIDSGDSVATELYGKFKNVRMPDQTLGDEDLYGVIDYLEDCTRKGGCKLVLGPVRNARDAKPDEIDSGRRLFVGQRRFAKGGPACVSCHSAGAAGRLSLGGGMLARDLTDVYARLGDQALHSALAEPGFPLMSSIFPKQPLEEAEVFQVKAFLSSMAKTGPPPPPDRNFGYLGVLGSFFSLGLAGAVWKDRMRGVRARLVARSRNAGNGGRPS